MADVPDRPKDLHYLRGMYRPFLRCSQNHQHIHHHRCIVAMLNDGSTSNMICFRLPRIISRKAVVLIFWIMNTIISTLFISSTDLPRNEVLAGVPFDKKSLETLSFVSFVWSSVYMYPCADNSRSSSAAVVHFFSFHMCTRVSMLLLQYQCN